MMSHSGRNVSGVLHEKSRGNILRLVLVLHLLVVNNNFYLLFYFYLLPSLSEARLNKPKADAGYFRDEIKRCAKAYSSSNIELFIGRT